MKDILKSAEKLVESQKTACIASMDEEGFPNIKAMLAPRKRVGLKTFYFTTNTSSAGVAQYRANNKASIYFYDKTFFKGCILKGTMEVLEDQTAKDMIWEKGDTQYYKLGVTDPDYCVLKFTAICGKYYSNLASQSFDVI